jgi:hypothetical protein
VTAALIIVAVCLAVAVIAERGRRDADLRDAYNREQQNARLRQVLGTSDDTRNFLGRF